MPKMKSHRGAAKRFRVTGTGKVKFKHAKLRHNLEHKPKATKKKLGKPGYLVPVEARKIKRLLRGG